MPNMSAHLHSRIRLPVVCTSVSAFGIIIASVDLFHLFILECWHKKQGTATKHGSEPPIYIVLRFAFIAHKPPRYLF